MYGIEVAEDEVCYVWRLVKLYPYCWIEREGSGPLDNDIFIVLNTLYINYYFKIANHVWIGNVHGGWLGLRLQ